MNKKKETKGTIVFITEGADPKKLTECITTTIPSLKGVPNQGVGVESIEEAHYMAEFLARDGVPYCIDEKDYDKGVKYDVWRPKVVFSQQKVSKPEKLEGMTIVI